MRRLLHVAVLAGLAATGCNPDWAKRSDADILLLISSIGGQAGGGTGTAATVLLSDVRNPGIINDNAQLVIRSVPKNPITSSEQFDNGLNDVFLQRYNVRFYRADGRSTPGVDVPHDLRGEMSGRIPPNGELTTSIIVVRHQAKLEPPLRNLASPRTAAGDVTGVGGMQLVTMFAEITVYGMTASERTVSAAGRLEIVFGDFADED